MWHYIANWKRPGICILYLHVKHNIVHFSKVKTTFPENNVRVKSPSPEDMKMANTKKSEFNWLIDAAGPVNGALPC